MRYLLRFGYDGAPFAGWARQPGLRTVEGEILRGLVRQGLQARVRTSSLEVASRTDRGVSARANVLGLESDLAPVPLLRALNGVASELYFTAAATVGDGFRVRSAERRIYRYYEPGKHDRKRWNSAGRRMLGTIDVRSFGRGIPSGSPTMRTVESIEMIPQPEGMVVEITAPSFVWGQVRKMVSALRAVEEGTLSETRLAAAARGETRLSLPLAEPERLVLWEVELPVAWTHRWTGPNRRQLAYLGRSRAAAWSRSRMLAELTERADSRRSGSGAG